MKRIGKILSLLLAAVMLLALLPSAAFADPPQSDPTHQHNWVVQDDTATCTQAGKRVWVCTVCGQTYGEASPAKGHDWNGGKVTKAATCETDGVKTYTCSRCQNTRTEAIHALGHDWDEGKVTTAPSGLTPGVKTYTCKRDASHTRTEEIDPLPWVFATLSGVTIDPSLFDLSNYDIPPLVITEQPVGGAITRYGDDSITLHVAATGGLGEYTYEWNYRINGKSTVENILSWVFLHTSGQRTEPDFEAEDGNMRYWCKVTDEAGNTAQSETAIVSYKVSIAKQPDNVNLQEADHDFYCEAIDGSGDYTYRWYDHDEGILGEGQSYPAEKEGYYYCIVTDNVTGETATSEYCEVYSTEPFRLADITGDFELTSDADAAVTASFIGGVEEYEIWWKKDGEAIDSVEDRDAQNNVRSRANVDGPGVYTVYGVDSMYATASGSVTITAPKLTIVEQPKDSIIPKGSYTKINVVVADGDMPYTYILYRNGVEYLTETDDDDSCPVGIWDPGEYYYHIEDSKGRMIDSDVVTFEDKVFRIKDQTESASLAKPGDTVSLFVEAEGGKEPYTYEWMQYKGDTPWYTKASATATCPARQPGRYACLVTDDTGEKLHSKEILVTYTGDTPWITRQPKSGVLEQGGSVTLSCDAVSGSGGELRFDWEVTPTGVRPSWSNVSRRGGSYKNIDATVPGTYRCKVTDTKTGKYVYTTAAFVGAPLEFGSIEITNYSQGRTPITISVKGGIAPYDVKVYVKYPYWTGTATEYKNVLFNHFSVNSLDEIAQKTIFLDDLVKYVGITSDGEPHYVNDIARYYIEVTDSLGNLVHTDFTPRDN